MGNFESSFSIGYNSKQKKVTWSWKHQTGINPGAQSTQTPQAQCAECMTAFSSPTKVLRCGHSFCFECLLDEWRYAVNRTHMKCPLCRKMTLVPKRNPSRLPNNVARMEMLGRQVVDTADPESDGSETADNSGCFSVSMAPSRADVETDSHVSSQYYPVTMSMEETSMLVEDYEIEHVQDQLEDHEEEAGPPDDYEHYPCTAFSVVSMEDSEIVQGPLETDMFEKEACTLEDYKM